MERKTRSFIHPRRWGRAACIAAVASAAILVVACGGSGGVAGTSKTANVLVVQALTGPGAADGQPDARGAQLAASDINAQGGIKSMGGAKINVVLEDAGATTDTAAAATQLGLSKGNISAGLGAELSSQTLAMEPVWTRAQVPWIAGSVADAILQQGSKYTFRESASTATENQIIPKELKQAAESQGKKMARVALVADNTAAPTANMVGFKSTFPAAGAQVVFSQQWTPPLGDPLALAQAIKASNPDVIYSGATAPNDIVALRKALVTVGVQALDFGTGVPNVSNAFLASAGQAADGYVAELPEAPVREEAQVASAYQKKYHEAFSGDSAYGYEEMWIIKAGLEAAKSSDPAKVRDALANIDLKGNTVPAPWVAGGRIKYDSTGQNTFGSVFFAQWQGGRVMTVFPANQATGHIQWPSA